MYKYKYSTGFLKNLIITARWYGELLSVSGLASFLPVQVDGTELSHHDKIVLMAESRLTARRFLVKVNFISDKAKNADSCAWWDGLEGLFAAFGLALGLSELQICLEATGRFINNSISQVSYSIF